MQARKVIEILCPFSPDLPASPVVHLTDRITDAITVMLTHNLTVVPVSNGKYLVGKVHLGDAIRSMGLEGQVQEKKAEG